MKENYAIYIYILYICPQKDLEVIRGAKGVKSSWLTSIAENELSMMR